ncbi:MAG: hypothetical protein ACI391_06250 [Muribaculaceae bacterium]
MNKYIPWLLILLLFCSSCSEQPKFVGSWLASAPTKYNTPMPENSIVNFVTSMDIMAGEDNISGPLRLSSLVDITQRIEGDTAVINMPYDVSVAASTTVSGTWTLVDEDEIAIAVDMKSLQVNINANSVTFSQNLLTKVDVATVDSLTEVAIDCWKKEVRRAWTYELSHLQTLDDVEVSENRNMLTFEVGNTGNFDIKLAYQRVINAD